MSYGKYTDEKIKHDGDCTIYSSLCNGNPEDGICTCGAGWKKVRKTGNPFYLYSDELIEKKREDGEWLNEEELSQVASITKENGFLTEESIKKLEEFYEQRKAG